jgi:hypothetical protein
MWAWRDFHRDWHRWTSAERLGAALLSALLAVSPASILFNLYPVRDYDISPRLTLLGSRAGDRRLGKTSAGLLILWHAQHRVLVVPERSADDYPDAPPAAASPVPHGQRQVLQKHADAWNLNRRLLATCWRGDLDLGRETVREGHAIAYRRFSIVYAPDEDDENEACAAALSILQMASRTSVSSSTTNSLAIGPPQ